MIERKFVSENMKEFRVAEFIRKQLNKAGLSSVKLKRTPLGEKIVVTVSRPGLVVGKGGSNIQRLTRELKSNFSLDNPQIEIEDVKSPNLDPMIIAESIASSLERFGVRQFKSAGHRALSNVMAAGAMGVEILISGRVPSQRAKTWRFYQGYLKKCGDVSIKGVDVAYATAFLKVGCIGVKVSIMPSTTILPDSVTFKDASSEPVLEEVSSEDGVTEVSGDEAAEDKDKKPAAKKSKSTKSKTTKAAKKEDASEKVAKEEVSVEATEDKE